MAKNYRSDSVYRITPIKNNRYLDILESPIEDISEYNTFALTITNKYEFRPDLLANELYGNAKLWWVFAMFNQDKLNDPIMDFVGGLEIQVPEKFS